MYERGDPAHEIEPPHRDPNGRLCSAVWMTYDLGRRLNHLRWSLELDVLLVIFPREEGPKALFHDLIACVRGILKEPATARVERVILLSLRKWRELVASESFIDTHIQTWETHLRWARDPDDLRDDEDGTRAGIEIVADIRQAFSHEIAGHPRLIQALALGELVDQALRPSRAGRFVFTDGLNPEYWRTKGSPRYRKATAGQRREFARRLEMPEYHEWLAKDDDSTWGPLISPRAVHAWVAHRPAF